MPIKKVIEWDILRVQKEGAIDDPHAVDLTEEEFSQLENYILQVNSRNQDREKPPFFSILFKNGEKVIQVRNYVGALSIPNSNLTLSIYPKILRKESDPFQQGQSLLREMLRTIYDFTLKKGANTRLPEQDGRVWDPFIEEFLIHCRYVRHEGLFTRYKRIRENSSFCRGKILWARQLKHNLFHAERFYTQTFSLDVDTPENRIVKTTLLFLQKVAQHKKTRQKVSRFLELFEGVPRSIYWPDDFDRIVIQKDNTHYHRLLQYARLFLSCKTLGLFAHEQADTPIRSFLVPMQRLFEKYIGIKLQEWAHTQHCAIKTSYTDVPKFFGIYRQRLDILLKTQRGRSIILDTKWKIPGNQPSLEDMRQMAIYQRKTKALCAILLYPKVYRYQKYCFYHDSRLNTTVHMCFVDLDLFIKEKDLQKLFARIAPIVANPNANCA